VTRFSIETPSKNLALKVSWIMRCCQGTKAKQTSIISLLNVRFGPKISCYACENRLQPKGMPHGSNGLFYAIAVTPHGSMLHL
jgi:hypothetical protein